MSNEQPPYNENQIPHTLYIFVSTMLKLVYGGHNMMQTKD